MLEPHKQRLFSIFRLRLRKTGNPMGAGNKPALWEKFDSRLEPEFHSSQVTSDAGLFAYRELDEAR
jgi:hypothetical protein